MRGTEQQSGYATGRKTAGRSWAGIKGALTDKCRQCPEWGLRPPHDGWIGLVRLGKLSPAASVGISLLGCAILEIMGSQRALLPSRVSGWMPPPPLRRRLAPQRAQQRARQRRPSAGRLCRRRPPLHPPPLQGPPHPRRRSAGALCRRRESRPGDAGRGEREARLKQWPGMAEWQRPARQAGAVDVIAGATTLPGRPELFAATLIANPATQQHCPSTHLGGERCRRINGG